jgi:hypothetical protein
MEILLTIILDQFLINIQTSIIIQVEYDDDDDDDDGASYSNMHTPEGNYYIKMILP